MPSPQITKEFVKNASVYDLINITLKSSDNKLSFMDRYIQRAAEKACIVEPNPELRDHISGEFSLSEDHNEMALSLKESYQ